MEGILIGLENWSVAGYFRGARWGYAFLNAGHILGISLLVGATVPINLRLLGCWRNVPAATVVRMLTPIAASGLVLTILAGLLLFSVRPREYADIAFFQVKLLLVFTGTVSALSIHWKYGMTLEGLTSRRRIAHAIVSLICWPGALVFGRLIAFSDT